MATTGAPAEHATRQPRAYGEAVLSARIRDRPEDFKVDELSSFEPSGSGEHLLLTVRKRGMTTAFAARTLAAWAGINDMGIGYAGLKDRQAVTMQRFSVHLPKRVAPDLATLESGDMQVVDHAWHNRKLSRGALAGNRFTLVLRDVAGARDAIEDRLVRIGAGGVPNYFGEQRFGRDGDNVEAARAMFTGQRVRREQRSIYLSAARSELFNAALAQRVLRADWNHGLAGEVWMLDGTHSVFGPEPLSVQHAERSAAMDIHPTGPMWGLGALRSSEDCMKLEMDAVAAHADLRAGLEQAGLKQERRSLRVRVAGLHWQWLDSAMLEISFTLAPGSYATEVLAELVNTR